MTCILRASGCRVGEGDPRPGLSGNEGFLPAWQDIRCSIWEHHSKPGVAGHPTCGSQAAEGPLQ